MNDQRLFPQKSRVMNPPNQKRDKLVGVRGFDSARPSLRLALRVALRSKIAPGDFVNFQPLPPESRSWVLTDCFY